MKIKLVSLEYFTSRGVTLAGPRQQIRSKDSELGIVVTTFVPIPLLVGHPQLVKY